MARKQHYQLGLIRRNQRFPDEEQQSWAIGPPPAAPPFDPATGFPWPAQAAAALELTGAPVEDIVAQAWAVGTAPFVPHQLADDASPVLPGSDDASQAWPVGPASNARVSQAAVEVLYSPTNPAVRVSQAVVEVLFRQTFVPANVPDEVALPVGLDEVAQPWAVSPPAAAAFDPATGFPWQGPAAADAPVVLAIDDVAQAWPIPPIALVEFQPQGGIPWNKPDETILGAGLDDAVQAWSVSAPPFVGSAYLDDLIAPLGFDDAQQAWAVAIPAAAAFDPATVPWATAPDDVSAATFSDDIAQSHAITPIALVEFQPQTGFPWTIADADPQAVPTADESIQAWALGPPLPPFVGNAPDEAALSPAADDVAQPWAIQPVAAAAFDPGSGFPWDQTDESAPAPVGVDDTLQSWAIGPLAFDARLVPHNVSDDAAAGLTDDAGQQAWAIAPPLPPFVGNAPDDSAAQPIWSDESQAWPISAAPFIGNVPSDDIVQPVWSDDTLQSWAIGPLAFDARLVPHNYDGTADLVIPPAWVIAPETTQPWTSTLPPVVVQALGGGLARFAASHPRPVFELSAPQARGSGESPTSAADSEHPQTGSDPEHPET